MSFTHSVGWICHLHTCVIIFRYFQTYGFYSKKLFHVSNSIVSFDIKRAQICWILLQQQQKQERGTGSLPKSAESWSLSLLSSGWQFFFPSCNGEEHKHIGSFCTWVELLAVVDNFSFSLSWTRGPNKVGSHTYGVHILCWVDMSLFWATVFWVCYLQTGGVRVCLHWVAVTTTSFFLKGFCGWESHVQVPQEALFSLGTRVERPSPL